MASNRGALPLPENPTAGKILGMAAEKVSVTVEEKLMRWARSVAKRRRMTLSAVFAEALELQRQHEARERFLEEALAGIPKSEIERRTAQAYREIFGRSDAAE